MTDERGEGVVEKTERALQKGHLAEPVVVHDRSGWHRAWRITRLGVLVILGLALVALAIVWIWRKPIAENVLADELEKRGVQATYTLDRVGFRTQQVSNLVIGGPVKPPL